MSTAALTRIASGRSRFATDLAEFVRFASVGADPRRRDDVAACAHWLAGRLRRAGLQDVELARTPGNPIVRGSWRGARGKPTILVYGHYDVQPADPVSAWRTPPFSPTFDGEHLFARGACDDKGPVLCHVAGIESHLSTAGRLPVNVECLFDGDEERDSPDLPAFLREHRDRLAPAVAVMSDTRMRGPGRPAIIDGTRGAVSFEVELSRSGEVLHAGQFGGAVANPLDALCAMLARLHDRSGRIAVPGLYDRVRRVTPEERARLVREAPSDAEVLASAGSDDASGEAGFSAFERTTLRPALVLTGLSGGYTGPGVQSALPARAVARLNLRLVPDQSPAEARRLVHDRLRALVPPGLALEVRTTAGARPTSIDRHDPAVRAAAWALHEAFGNPPVLMRSGGSIPVVDVLHRLFAIPVVLMGFALPDDGMHAPNERVHLPTLHRGTVACSRFLELVATEASAPVQG